ncbi:MAG: DUF1894 domain-containing protein [Methanomicrobiaceae archaeon]|nr:DUF1894 domain-containing protein [Methanomicrobiaceae archaeon]
MGCIEAMHYEILLQYCSFSEASEYIKKNAEECYVVPPGFKIYDLHIIGVPPILLGIKEGHIILPYTKPCHGTFLLKIPGDGELEYLRKKGTRIRG